MTGEAPQARLTLSAGGTERHAESSGSGPVDATFKAIENVAVSGSELLLYSVNAITTGTDAQGEVTVRRGLEERARHAVHPEQSTPSTAIQGRP